MLLAKMLGFTRQNFAYQARNFIKASRRVKSLVLMACDGTCSMKQKSSAKSLVRLSSPSDSTNDWAKPIMCCPFVPVSSRFCQLLENACHKHHSIEVFRVNMHVRFPETNALLLQHVVETKINAKITRKKWLNKAFRTQKPHRNHLEPI